MSATLSTSDLWMKLESLAHLRGLPQFKNASKAIVAELAAHDAALAPKAAAGVRVKVAPGLTAVTSAIRSARSVAGGVGVAPWVVTTTGMSLIPAARPQPPIRCAVPR